MRGWVVACLVPALFVTCTPDTFETVDAAPDSTVADGANDASDAGPLSSLGSKLVLWLVADDVPTNGSTWPDRSGQNDVTHVVLAGGTTVSCDAGQGIHVVPNTLQGHAGVTFCSAWLDVADSVVLQLQTKPFVLAAIVRMTSGPLDQTLFTKTLGVANLAFTLTAPTAGGAAVQGNLLPTITAAEPIDAGALGLAPRYIDFVRDKSMGDDIYVQVGATQGTPVDAGAGGDISDVDADIIIGGLGNSASPFAGELIELVLADDTGPLELSTIETYLKTKYNQDGG